MIGTDARLVTLKDIAADARVSVSTVSLVMSGRGPERGVAPGTALRVKEAAVRLGYRHNVHARALRTGRTRLIGVVGVDLNHPVPLMGMRAAAQAVLERSFSVTLHDLAWQRDSPDRALEELESRRVEGLVFVTGRGLGEPSVRAVLDRMVRRGIPMVTLDDWGFPGADVVTVDRALGAYLATRHLLDQGHRRIVLGVPPDATAMPIVERIRGYRQAHADAGVPADPSLLIPRQLGLSSYQEGMEIISRVLAHPLRPTAVFLSNDRVAFGALRALHEAGLRVPDDMAVVGFDGIEEAEFAMVPLTTVEQPMDEVAKRAVTLLTDRLTGRLTDASPRRIVVSPRLVVRRSSQEGRQAPSPPLQKG